ncbi:hypothetical protein G3I76_52180, partial [Streptomyces sp. SID11233]|nr:hypothetical protein [Streptomyces sp. SID11233]
EWLRDQLEGMEEPVREGAPTGATLKRPDDAEVRAALDAITKRLLAEDLAEGGMGSPVAARKLSPSGAG